MQNTVKKNRINILDEVRGALIILVVAYHLLFDLAVLYEVQPLWGAFRTAMVFQPVLPFMFILISGISFMLSRSNLRRGLMLLGISLVITLATWIAVPDYVIWFGLLHFLALVHLVFAPLKRFFEKLPMQWGAAVCAVSLALFVLTYNIEHGYFGIDGLFTLPVPDFLTDTNWLIIFGFHAPGFTSSDYFPLMPWIFVFITGIVLGKYIHRLPERLKKPHIRPLAFLGRHTLIIYLAHQPLIYGILWVVMR